MKNDNIIITFSCQDSWNLEDHCVTTANGGGHDIQELLCALWRNQWLTQLYFKHQLNDEIDHE